MSAQWSVCNGRDLSNRAAVSGYIHFHTVPELAQLQVTTLQLFSHVIADLVEAPSPLVPTFEGSAGQLIYHQE